MFSCIFNNFKGSERKITYYEKIYHIHQQNLIFPPCSTTNRDCTQNLKQIGCYYVYEKHKARNCLTYGGRLDLEPILGGKVSNDRSSMLENSSPKYENIS